MKQIPLPIFTPPEPTFDNFVPGANAPALDHLRSLAMPAAPEYLWGPPGSGKTHLLRAWAARNEAQGRRVGWFDAADRLPWVLGPGWAAVVFDRCELMGDDAQHAAFAVFVDATTQGVQVAAAGRLPPVDLPLRDDLRTRLAWGHVFALQAPSDAEARAALRREGDARGVMLPDEVMDHLLNHFPRDLSYLMRLVRRLDEYSMSRGRRVTVPLLRAMLAEEGQGEVSTT